MLKGETNWSSNACPISYLPWSVGAGGIPKKFFREESEARRDIPRSRGVTRVLAYMATCRHLRRGPSRYLIATSVLGTPVKAVADKIRSGWRFALTDLAERQVACIPNPHCVLGVTTSVSTCASLIATVVVVALALGWIVRLAQIQRDAVVAIRTAGGAVKYDWEWANGSSIPGGSCRAPAWLVRRVGVDYFGHVTTVTLGERQIDEAIVHVSRLSRLEALDLNSRNVSDASLATCAGLPA